MAKLLRWLLVALAVTVLTALVEPWVVKGLDYAGWYDNPGGVVVNWLSRLVGEQAFPWVAATILGLAVGVWLDWLARRFDRSPVTLGISLATGELAAVVERLRQYVRMLDDNEIGKDRPTMSRLREMRADLMALHVSLEKMRLSPPLYPHYEEDPIRFIRDNLRILEPIQALMAAGHIAEARQLCAVFRNDLATNAGAKTQPQQQPGTAVETQL